MQVQNYMPGWASDKSSSVTQVTRTIASEESPAQVEVVWFCSDAEPPSSTLLCAQQVRSFDGSFQVREILGDRGAVLRPKVFYAPRIKIPGANFS
jgi:hypothetical protein